MGISQNNTEKKVNRLNVLTLAVLISITPTTLFAQDKHNNLASSKTDDNVQFDSCYYGGKH